MDTQIDLFDVVASSKDVSTDIYCAEPIDKWNYLAKTLKTDVDLNLKEGRYGQSLSNMIEEAVESIYRALVGGWIMYLSYSSGKDSEVVLHLFLIALIRAVRNKENISQHHFLINIDTRIENPEVHALCNDKLEVLDRFVRAQQLPLKIIIAQPNLSQSWAGRVLTGRGLPTFVNTAVRQCSQELKIAPASREKKRYLKTLNKQERKKVCLLLGSRDSESSIRAANIGKRNGSHREVTLTPQGGELYPVKSWLSSHIWEFLLSSGNSDKYSLPSYLESNRSTADLYSEATGECLFGSESLNRASEVCGPRFGCFLCLANSKDRSMENLINSGGTRYDYLKNINRLHTFLNNRKYEWNDRHPIGKTIYEGGFIKLQHDVYSPKFLSRLLHICISIDYVEIKRAKKVALELEKGCIENTAFNRRISQPQFRIVSEEALVHIDFMWSHHVMSDKPFSALEIFHKVWTHGQLDLIEDDSDLVEVPRTERPKAHWIKVPKWGTDHLSDGYYDSMAAAVLFNTKGKELEVSYDDELTVDEELASHLIWKEYPSRVNTSRLDGLNSNAATLYYLRTGTVKLAKGKKAVYEKMASRGQTLSKLGLTGPQQMEQVLQRRDIRIVTTQKCHAVAARKARARLVRARWWGCMSVVITLNIYNKTSLGKYLIRCSTKDATDSRLKRQTEWYIQLRKEWCYIHQAYAFGVSHLATSFRDHLKNKYSEIQLNIRRACREIGNERVVPIISELIRESEELKKAVSTMDIRVFNNYSNDNLLRCAQSEPVGFVNHLNYVESQLIAIRTRLEPITSQDEQLCLSLVA